MWHLRIYLNGCGWDGEPAIVNFAYEADAAAAMLELERLWQEGIPEEYRDIHELQLGIDANDVVTEPKPWAQAMFEQLREEVAQYENGPWWTR